MLFVGAIVIGPILLALRLLDIHYGPHLLPHADDATAGVAAATN